MPKLKKLLAEQMLDMAAMKELLVKKMVDARREARGSRASEGPVSGCRNGGRARLLGRTGRWCDTSRIRAPDTALRAGCGIGQ